MIRDLLFWEHDWILGGALAVATLVLHIIGLNVIVRLFERRLAHSERRAHGSVLRVALILAPTLTLILFLHGFEAAIWAATYVLLGAMPDYRQAMLYSLEAMTSYGHAPIHLSLDWQLLGPIQALAGMLAFGLTIAFLTTVARRMWSGRTF